MEVAVATKLKATSFHLDGGQQADSAVADNRTTHKGVPRSPFFTLLVGGSNPMPEIAKNLTDGDRFSTCVNTEEARDLTLTFSALTLLERIMIYTPGSSEWKAEVMCYDVCETLVMTTALSSGVSRVYQVNVNTNVKKVHIKILSGTLNMCELQAYADPEGPLEDQIMASQAPDAQSSGAFMLLLTTLLVASCVVCSGMFLLRKRSNETLDNAEE
ncbi:uncharacterized protein LOC131948322 [Physella acuta]|uniref:uncharacterized protein LOC131948322 n=1 Tax=Physella acuta TaxID=109671 RepID=UPI0027DC833A|nr:uncharacterized protein LOC131948322 [Physella acuta]